MKKDEIRKILEEHKDWACGNGGKRADLYNANLRNADLSGADLCGADLRNADLCNADGIHLACPEAGEFIGFKKAKVVAGSKMENVIVKLKITEDAKRSSANTRKCRCDKANVVSITSIDGAEEYESAISKFSESFIYRVGETVKVEDFDENRWNECSTGIHFFITRQEAVEY